MRADRKEPAIRRWRRPERLLGVFIFPIIFALSPDTRGEEYPTRSIRMIVPYPAGGSTDVLGRRLAAFMSEDLKRPVIVENRAGAQGAIGAEIVARSAPDGYTLLIASSSLTIIKPLLYKTLAYNPTRDFQMLSMLGESPLVLVVRPSLPARTLNELVSLAKKEGENLNFSSAGTGTTLHMAVEMLKDVADIKMTHVPFTGSAPALNMLLAGQVDLMFADVPNVIPHIRAGSVRPLAVSTRARNKVLPQIPTMAEAGFPDVEVHTWFGVAVPARVPAGVAGRIKAAADRALEDREFRESLSGMGFILDQPLTFAQAKEQIEGERRRWAKVVSNQKISLE